MMPTSDHCADCGTLLPIDRPVFQASGNRGVRCEKCELAAVRQQEVERLREHAQRESAR